MMGLVLAGAAAFALTACSGNNASQSTEAAATTVPGTQTEAAAETESGSYTVTDVRGKEIEFDVVPERVATVGKPFPSIYYAIEGATDNIVKLLRAINLLELLLKNLRHLTWFNFI